MSFRLHLANLVLRLFEKPHLTRATPQELRVAFERKAQVFFHPPKGTVFSRQHLKTPSGSLQLQWVHLLWHQVTELLLEQNGVVEVEIVFK